MNGIMMLVGPWKVFPWIQSGIGGKLRVGEHDVSGEHTGEGLPVWGTVAEVEEQGASGGFVWDKLPTGGTVWQAPNMSRFSLAV